MTINKKNIFLNDVSTLTDYKVSIEELEKQLKATESYWNKYKVIVESVNRIIIFTLGMLKSIQTTHGKKWKGLTNIYKLLKIGMANTA